MKLLKRITDRFVIIYLSISLPCFLLIIMGIVFFSAIIDKVSFEEAFEALQLTLPVIIAYVGAILGYAFNKGIIPKCNEDEISLKAIVSFILTFGIMFFMLVMSCLLPFDLIKFDEFKQSIAGITWALSGLVSFIIGRYFGENVVEINLKDQ